MDKTCELGVNGRKYTMDFDYFKKWNSDMAYILGFIAADGSIVNYCLKISLQIDDIRLLEDIKNKLKFTGNVLIEKAKCKGKEYLIATLRIYSQYLVNTLKDLKITERKSLTLDIRNVIPKEYELDFIRGYFDGNGSIGTQYPTNSKGLKSKTIQIRTRFFTGSKNMAEWIVDTLEKYDVKRVNIHKDNKKELYNIEYSTNASILIYELLYKDKELYLERKKNKFDESIKIRNNQLELKERC